MAPPKKPLETEEATKRVEYLLVTSVFKKAKKARAGRPKKRGNQACDDDITAQQVIKRRKPGPVPKVRLRRRLLQS